MRGRKPKPTALKLLTGERRPSRINYDEPRPPASAPPMPSWLPDGAKPIWKQLVKQLATMGTLSSADEAVMTSYCVTYSRMQEAEGKVAETGGDIVRSVNGHPQINPWLTVQRKAQEQLKSLAIELGLTPCARTKIRVTATNKTNTGPKAKYFTGGAT
ncbi:MAG: hypothetical protein AMXMBFR13_22470 [Phycisphaerae bacterium]